MEKMIEKQVANALFEDLNGSFDVTSLIVEEHKLSKAFVLTRENMVFCGSDWIKEIALQMDRLFEVKLLYSDGDFVSKDSVLFELYGNSRAILTAERTILNFVQTLSSVATVTKKYIDQMSNRHVKLLDTRKTIPGFRVAQKYAVTCGGGFNHRIGLFDAFLIKENHIKAAGSISEAIDRARAIDQTLTLEVEVENIDELESALACSPDIIMLDNFSLDDLYNAVKIRDLLNKDVLLEASGDITLDNIKDKAKSGIDYISVGALTKNINAINLSMRFVE